MTKRMARREIRFAGEASLFLLSFPAHPQMTNAQLCACELLCELENPNPVDVLGTVLALRCDSEASTSSATLPKNLILDLKACD